MNYQLVAENEADLRVLNEDLDEPYENKELVDPDEVVGHDGISELCLSDIVARYNQKKGFEAIKLVKVNE